MAYEMYTGGYDLFNMGSTWQIYAISYPATQSDGTRCWGLKRHGRFNLFNPDKQCFEGFFNFNEFGQVRTTNANGIPDSIRIGLRKSAQCWRFGITTNCGNTLGGYIDNVSLGIIDGAVKPMSVLIWELWQDTFPANETPGLAGTAAFDTTAALIKSGLNTSPLTGDLTRYDVPGDTLQVDATGDDTEVQLKFRILPGPGNYVVPGDPCSGLRRVPSSATAITTTDGSFWTEYILNPGKDKDAMPTTGPCAGGGALSHKQRWDELTWCNARMDTAEANLLPIEARGINTPVQVGTYATMYHEDDKHLATLGIPRNKCFLVDTLLAANSSNIVCNGTVPAWVTASGVPYKTGYDGNPTTTEGTKILPDGLFTPGTHIAYFFRREDLPPSAPFTFNCPDTNLVSPQNAEGSTDGHRWQEVSVLPDRWKDSDYIHPVLGTPGGGEACVLLVDNNDRRGNERVWLGMADTLGMTSAAKRGGSNGWSAPGGGADVNDPTYFVRRHVGQAGTTFDKYDIKASESLDASSGSLGSRLGFADPSNTQIDGKRSFGGPSVTMMNKFYKVLFLLTGDLNSQIWGPFRDKSANDVGIMTSFATSGDPSDPNRGLYVAGNGWNEAATGAAYTFITTILGADLINVSYLAASGNTAFSADILPTTALATANGDIYGLRNACTFTLDVQTPVLNEATESSFYEDPFGNGPHPSGILKTHTALNPWIALSDGWDIEVLSSRDERSTRGRLIYYYRALQDAFGTIAGCNIIGVPLSTTDTPNNGNGRLFNFMSLRNNPVRSGSATFAIGVAKSDWVTIRIFDVAGRLVRTLADRNFAAGEHSLTWDGRDATGGMAQSGVYFLRAESAGSVQSQRVVRTQ